MIAESLDLYENHRLDESSKERFYLPFPMGVFGTLRESFGNHRLMHGGKINSMRRAFLPNFIAVGLGIRHKPKGCAAFEVYFYEPQEWQNMIGRVDRLEGFSPGYTHYQYGYYRTLAWVHLLPENDKPKVFDLSLSQERDLKIPQEEWDQYEKVPVWVYSSINENQSCNGYPVIWGE